MKNNTLHTPEPVPLWAAMDLGSNSFHLLIARRMGCSFQVVERLKEKVQLLGGFSEGAIHPHAAQRGLACLRRFAQRLAPIPRQNIRVMGTFALRQARNAGDFTDAAAAILGLPVQVISGQQEGRLIYRAVEHHISSAGSACGVIDIGGGSTELAFGNGGQAQQVVSANVGCVAFKDRYFTPGSRQSSAYEAARTEALQVVSAALARDQGASPVTWYGTSGTIQSIAAVLSANGWSRDQITRRALAQLESSIVDDRWVLQAGLPGLAADRADIFAGGVAILSACFTVAGIDKLQDVDVSLLQGMICDTLLENTQTDLRDDSVMQLARRFGVDEAQAERVAGTAMSLFAGAGEWWDERDDYRQLLRWAARLHEVGAHISPRHYHRHGAYIIKHTQLPGFSDLHKSMLALLIRGHRRSLPGLAFQIFDAQTAAVLLRLVALLRLAVILQRSHNDADSPQVSLQVKGNEIQLNCGPGWLQAHPLSARELEVEQEQLRTAGILLSVESN